MITLPSITFKIISKDVTGLSWDQDIKLNYFRALIVVGGEELDPNTMWSKSEDDAIKESCDWLSQHYYQNHGIERAYKGWPMRQRGRAAPANYVGYFVLSTEEAAMRVRAMVEADE